MPDVVLEIIIPGGKVAIASAQFLREQPIPLIDDPDYTGDDPIPQIPEYTIKQWIKEFITDRLKSECYQGKLKLQTDVTEPDGDLFI